VEETLLALLSKVGFWTSGRLPEVTRGSDPGITSGLPVNLLETTARRRRSKPLLTGPWSS
jgi:hypothetical protein